jgi:hypothetical protein
MRVIISIAFLVSAANGFVPTFGIRSPMRLVLAARPDTSALVEEALKITATLGIDSSEAKVAWDVVEEIDGSDNR